MRSSRRAAAERAAAGGTAPRSAETSISRKVSLPLSRRADDVFLAEAFDADDGAAHVVIAF